jgi:putative SOS response-associated peptidase YedK
MKILSRCVLVGPERLEPRDTPATLVNAQLCGHQHRRRTASVKYRRPLDHSQLFGQNSFMRARYTLRSPADLLAERFGLLQPPDLQPRFNIAPSQLIPVIGTKAGRQGRGLAHFKLGFLPHWSQDGSGMKPVNARAETVATTPMFADSFRLRRCIVPADGFYEWKTVNKKKMPVHFRLKTGELFGFAGIWDVWNGPAGKVLAAT